MTRWRRLLLLVLALSATITACGVPDAGPARTVDAADVPHGLLEERSGQSRVAREPASVDGSAAYFTRSDRLVRVGLRLSTSGRPALPQALEALSAGPTRPEQERGLGTAIPPGMVLVATSVVGGQAVIDLRGETAHPDIDENALATGQIVLTATSVRGIRSVVLTRDGRPVAPVLPQGDLATRPVMASDYAVLVPTPPPE